MSYDLDPPESLDAQTATAHACQQNTLPQTSPKQTDADLDGHQAESHVTEAEYTDSMHEAAIAQYEQSCIDGAMVRHHQRYEDGLCARDDLARHIVKSLPCRSLPNVSTPSKSWFAIHERVARFALHQAHRAACQRGLKRVSDTKHFVAQHCYWYLLFCRFSRWLLPKKIYSLKSSL